MIDDGFITVDRVTKGFGHFTAINGIDLKISRGEFFSLLGPSGCGKTTLLRMLAGFETPTDGEIYIDGQALAFVPANHRPTNMVFQSYAIFPHLNVRQNIGFGLRKERLSKQEYDRRVDEALQLVHLEKLGTRRSNELSGGQRQRVALARALINRPKVLLLDEPLAALDKKLREAMQWELRKLQRSVGITFVFVTHDQEEALAMSDRIAVMFEGRIAQVDTPRDLYAKPNSREVAGFIGQVNMLPAKVRHSAAGSVTVDCAGFGVVDAAATLPIECGTDITLAIRPECLSLASGRATAEERSVKATLKSSSFLGDRVHHVVEVEGCAQPLLVSGPGLQTDRMPGTDLWLSFERSAAIVLA